jgi:hypothetical protein
MLFKTIIKAHSKYPSLLYRNCTSTRTRTAVTHVNIEKLMWKDTTTNERYIWNKDPICRGDPNPGEVCTADYSPSVVACSNPSYPNCIKGLCWEKEKSSLTKETPRVNCNQDFGGSSYPCKNEDYPICFDFVQGSSWGTCYGLGATNDQACNDYGEQTCDISDYPLCRDGGCYPDLEASECYLPEPWYDITVWGDLIALNVYWELGESINNSCNGTVSMELDQQNSAGTPNPIVSTSNFATGHASMLLKAGEQGETVLMDASANQGGIQELAVTSATGGTTVLKRSNFGDIFVHVPTSTRKCGYSKCRPWALASIESSPTTPFAYVPRTAGM